MAQTGYTPILIYSSSTAAAAPVAGNLTNSTLGSELAINITDGKLFYKDNANAIQVIGWKVVPATAGGTGQTSYAVGDILYANTTTSLAKLADVATGNALISGGVGVAPAYGKIGLTTHVSGTLPTANGGTNLTSFTANGLVYASSTSALATSASLTWNGTVFAIGAAGNAFSFTSTTSSTAYNAAQYSNFGGSIYWGVDNSAGTAFNGLAYAGVIGTSNATAFEIFTNNVVRQTWHSSGGVSIGNTTDPGATNLSVTGRTVSALFRTDSGQIVPASGITTTIFTCPTLDNGCYLVTCNIPGQAPPTYSAVGLVRVGGTTLNFTSLAAATTLTISVNGQNIRVVQNSGGTNAVDWTVTRIS